LKTYNFDRVIDRHNTNSLKYDYPEDFGYTNEHLPLWVADMDFTVADEIKEALHKTNALGIFGYTKMPEKYFDVVSGWMIRHHNFKTEREWMITTPGVVFSLSTAIRALTETGDAVIILTPVYSPFRRVVENNNRKLIKSSLIYNNGRYTIDYADFEKQIISNSVKLFILCNPHNPVGRVFTKDELIRIGHICRKHNVIIVCDEIHEDFIYEPNRHIVIADLNSDFEQRCVICTAPSKTFNIAGLEISNIFIPNPDIRKRFKDELVRMSAGMVNSMGIIATMAAYKYGDEWLSQLLAYLKGNVDYVREFLTKNTPKIKLVEPEGTYLIWIDCKDMGMSNAQVNSFFKDEAKLFLDTGDIFGSEGECFQRINIGTNRKMLESAMNRIKCAYKKLFSDKENVKVE